MSSRVILETVVNMSTSCECISSVMRYMYSCPHNFDNYGSNKMAFHRMELLRDDINHISRNKFGSITLKVIFQGQKGQIWPFFTWSPFAPKLFCNFSFCIELPKQCTNELSKYRFAWIALKVLCQGRQVRFWPLSHILTYVFHLFKTCSVTFSLFLYTSISI